MSKVKSLFLVGIIMLVLFVSITNGIIDTTIFEGRGYPIDSIPLPFSLTSSLNTVLF